MKEITARPMEIANPLAGNPRIYIPGGWTMICPEVKADLEAHSALVGYFKPKLGARAEDRAREVIQRCFEYYWRMGVKNFIRRRATEYAEMFPDLHTPTKVGRRHYVQLRGFNPEAILHGYVPFDQTSGSAHEGRGGKPYVRDALVKMGQEAQQSAPTFDGIF